MTTWFPNEGAWHVLVGEKGSLCHMELLNPPEHQRTPDDPSDLPPKPCRTCLLSLAMTDVEDEPIEVAKARGYVPAEPLPDETLRAIHTS